MEPMTPSYPIEFDVEYPDRELDRTTSAFRIIVAIPILLVLGAIGGSPSTPTETVGCSSQGWAAGC